MYRRRTYRCKVSMTVNGEVVEGRYLATTPDEAIRRLITQRWGRDVCFVRGPSQEQLYAGTPCVINIVRLSGWSIAMRVVVNVFGTGSWEADNVGVPDHIQWSAVHGRAALREYQRGRDRLG